MNRVVFILVASQFLLSCGSKSSDSSTVADSLVYGDTLAVSDDPGFDYDQQLVNQMLSDFNSARRTYDSVSFTTEYEMGSSRVHYYFQNNDLMYIHKEATGEGGFYERSLMMVGESGIEEGFKINSEDGGWFTYLVSVHKVGYKKIT